ncbi:MAG: EamA family transporter [Hyphomicrobiaceae bacterium]|nr:EamA family transporter [Hyphomicrobiaceae bacterium]
MKRLVILGFIALLGIDTAQQILAKFAADIIGPFALDLDWLRKLTHERLLYVLLGLYILAFLIYSWLLRHAPVGPSYAAMHGHVVTTFLFSLFFLGERLTLLQLSGCALIVAGIVLLAVTEEL